VRSLRKPLEAKSPRMGALARLPVFFALTGKRALLAGGSAAAAWKAELLSAAGAHVDVYAPAVSSELRQLADAPPAGAIVLHDRAWTADDFAGAAIAIGAFEDDADAEAFARAARAAGAPVNVIDKPADCDFSFGSIVNRSPLVIGISTDGAAPVFAQAIRAKLEALLPNGFAAWAAAAARWRDAVMTAGLSSSARRRFWQLFTAHAVSHPEKTPAQTDFDDIIDAVKGLGERVEHGSVTLVGAGPGDPELLTLRAVRAMQSADVILFDELVSAEVLDFARREAKKILVGKTGHGPSCKQEEINTLMVALARQGRRVVRLKGGDPLVFGRASEEIEACRAANLPVEIVPGISAVQGAAATLTLPLTDRAHARRLQYITGHGRNGALPEDIDWQSLTDEATTTAIYMPLRTLKKLVTRALAEGLDPHMPALAIARATRTDQRNIAAPISEMPGRIAHADLPGPILIIMGQVCRRVSATTAALSAETFGNGVQAVRCP
jgi:uroporphyrin-III C-methyltransferase/precorrin-2 dehydrogenase/sirohydrochlorin ferrochelatase